MVTNLFNVKNKVVIVTGGTGLLGQEYCKVLAENGARVVITDLDLDLCIMRAKELTEKYGANCIGLRVDVSNINDVIDMIKKVDNVFGRIDCLINNAAFNCPVQDGSSNFFDFVDYPASLFRASVDVNIMGPFFCCQKIIEYMVTNNIKGSIINICSTYGLVSPKQSLYSHIKEGDKVFVKPVDYAVTKSAITNLTRYLATYYGGKGIRVNTLTPGGVFDHQGEEFVKKYSENTPIGRMANKTEYNGAILYLCSNASSYMTGSNLIIDGGWTSW